MRMRIRERMCMRIRERSHGTQLLAHVVSRPLTGTMLTELFFLPNKTSWFGGMSGEDTN
ncbi:hypothetical protein DY000_02031879 [Brassica cretica]|uniref:Uncharacterized protein n=1 Tax=Brassica cretica TaxID=69181 RepID=A0ABQ7DK07_BRACR|nr:hypothetical protein DY000_02031879 [Brassica cretica]